jgi:hypothetical protein
MNLKIRKMKAKNMYLATNIFTVIVLVALLALKVNAGETTNLKLVPYTNERAIVVMNNQHNLTSELTVEDANGEVLYYREGKINAVNYSKVFDFKNLKNGDYKIVVKNNAGTQEAYFSVSNSSVKIDENKSDFNPYFEFDNNVLKLSALNHQQKPLYITIKDEDGVLYSKTLGADFAITAGFDMKKLTSGEYTANISDGFNTISYSFKK